MELPSRILVVDDDEAVVLTLQALLERAGHVVRTAAGFGDARVMLDAERFDVVLVDLMLTGDDGFRVLGLLRETAPDVTAIVLTGYASLASTIRAIRLGVADYLLKPCPVDELHAAVARGLERRRAILGARERAAAEREQLLAREQAARRQAERSAARLSHLQELTLDVSRTLSPDELFPRIVDAAVRLLDAPVAAVFLWDAERGGFQLASGKGLDKDEPTGLRLPFSGSLAGRALTESHAIAIDDVQAIPDVVLPRLVSGAAIGALLVAPIATPSEQLGVIEVYSPTPRGFSADDADLLTALAATAAIALQNARLYQDARAAIGLREEFLSAAAHELKTPLTGLLASAQYVVRVLDAEGRVDPTSLRQRLATIDDQAHKLARLVEQLLDVSRLEAGRLRVEMSETDLAALVAAVAAAARARTTRHGIRLHAPESVRALVDPFRVEQVVTNLIDNAIKYSPNGGPIDVAVHRVGPDQVEIRVTDRGIGIPSEHRDRIFDRFYQANAGAHYGGLGLGLYISRQIVELHGGSLDVELPDEGGARFVVRLPRAPAPAQTPAG